MVRQNCRTLAALRQIYAQLVGQWAKVIGGSTRSSFALPVGRRILPFLVAMVTLGCATETKTESHSRVRMQVPPGVARVVVIGSATDDVESLPGEPIHDEIGRQRRPSSILLKPDREDATTTWIDPSPLSDASFAEGTALATPRLENTRRVVLLTDAPRVVAGLLELSRQPNQPALEVVAERSLLDGLVVDAAIAAALGADRLSFRAIAPQTRVDLGDGIAITLLKIGDDTACRIEGPKRRILYAPRIHDPAAPGWERALAESDFRILDARLDPRAASTSSERRVPAVPAAAHRIRGFPSPAGSVRFTGLDHRYGIDGNRFIDDFRARGFEIVFEGDEYWL